ncbi:MAG: hypothetical protein Q9160_003805 [Pyrenula sp. 1 TL-2023]
MKFPVAQAGACLLLFQPFASALTYWVDQSCRNTQARQRAFDAAIQQAIDLANRGFTRLQSNTDTDMKGNVDRIYSETVTITKTECRLCDVQLNSALHSFADIPLKKDIAGIIKPPNLVTGIDAFSTMTAFTLLHEFAHTLPFNKQDVGIANGGRAYAWADIVNLQPNDSRNNVNNYVFTALLAVLADRHWRLSKVYNEWHNRGALVYDLHGITQKVKRWVKEWAA